MFRSQTNRSLQLFPTSGTAVGFQSCQQLMLYIGNELESTPRGGRCSPEDFLCASHPQTLHICLLNCDWLWSQSCTFKSRKPGRAKKPGIGQPNDTHYWNTPHRTPSDNRRRVSTATLTNLVKSQAWFYGVHCCSLSSQLCCDCSLLSQTRDLGRNFYVLLIQKWISKQVEEKQSQKSFLGWFPAK